jgi:orotidine-5'-phosphate decarboxylase
MRDVIIACDFSSREELFNFLKPFEGYNPYLKVGMELFYAEGPDMVKELKEKGFKIFLDLKLYDIPNTVKKAMVNLGKLGVDITNVHASGGITMMKAAKDGLLEGAKMAGYELLLHNLHQLIKQCLKENYVYTKNYQMLYLNMQKMQNLLV